jgi:hypothetical protein
MFGMVLNGMMLETLLDPLVQLVLLETQELLDHKVLLEPQVPLEPLELQVLQVLLDHRVYRA